MSGRFARFLLWNVPAEFTSTALTSGTERKRPKGGDGGPFEAASYMVTATAELAAIARRHRLDMLVYLLDMAHLEAEEIVRLGSSGNSHSTG
jgi:hypothetical protein